MNIAVISYSYTGNNKFLAGSVAKELAAEHIRISESKSRTMGTIIWDMIFNRTPPVQPAPDIMDKYDLILFFAPVWMGHVAAPLRAYLKHLKLHRHRFGFLSISGGADGANLKLADELRKRTGEEPVILLDLHISDLLPSEPKPARKDTSVFRIKEGDVKELTSTAVKKVRDVL